MKSKGLIIAGTQSSSGKTALTSMLLAAMKQRRIPVQPFKVGPDFIDPGYHRVYSGEDVHVAENDQQAPAEGSPLHQLNLGNAVVSTAIHYH